MAARSPNVKLAKALGKKNASQYMKCPLSAPPKHSKPLISKLGVTSISRKLFEKKDITQAQPPNTSSTPKQKGRQVAPKYMTTSRRTVKSRFDPATFRSTRNPSRTSAAGDTLPKTTSSAAKALSFDLQQKPTMCSKAKDQSDGGRTPIRKLCERMQMLELRSQKKQQRSHSKDILISGKDKDKGKCHIKKQVRFAEDHLKDTRLAKSSSRDATGEPEGTSTTQSPNAMYNGKQNEEPGIADEDKENDPATVAGKDNNNYNIETTVITEEIKVAKITGRKQVMVSAVKYRKPKLTNPKPFRLRTDERGILKEANMVKKIKIHPYENASENLPAPLPKIRGILKEANMVKKVKIHLYENASEDLRCKGVVAPQPKDVKHILSTVRPLKEKGPTRVPFSKRGHQNPQNRVVELSCSKPNTVRTAGVENVAPQVNLKRAARRHKFEKIQSKELNFQTLHGQKKSAKVIS